MSAVYHCALMASSGLVNLKTATCAFERFVRHRLYDSNLMKLLRSFLISSVPSSVNLNGTPFIQQDNCETIKSIDFSRNGLMIAEQFYERYSVFRMKNRELSMVYRELGASYLTTYNDILFNWNSYDRYIFTTKLRVPVHPRVVSTDFSIEAKMHINEQFMWSWSRVRKSDDILEIKAFDQYKFHFVRSMAIHPDRGWIYVSLSTFNSTKLICVRRHGNNRKIKDKYDHVVWQRDIDLFCCRPSLIGRMVVHAKHNELYVSIAPERISGTYPCIGVFDANTGAHIRSIHPAGPLAGYLGATVDFAIHPISDDVYCADANCIYVYTREGDFRFVYRLPPIEPKFLIQRISFPLIAIHPHTHEIYQYQRVTKKMYVASDLCSQNK